VSSVALPTTPSLTTANFVLLLAIIILPTALNAVISVNVLAHVSMPIVGGAANLVIMLNHSVNDVDWHLTAAPTIVKFVMRSSAKQINTATYAKISITPLRIIVNFVGNVAILKTITVSDVNNLVIRFPSVPNQTQSLSNYVGRVAVLDMTEINVATDIKMSCVSSGLIDWSEE
jgi:hypothetical protein